LSVLVPAPSSIATAQRSDLVFLQRGTMPILLTAPHGGDERVPGIPARLGGINERDTNARDFRTRELALAISAGLEARFCQKPYLVLAEFHRRYLDVNRIEAEAYEDPAAAPYYAAYHAGIRGFVDEIRERFPDGSLMIDVHGQSGEPSVIFRGTRDGLTVSHLLDARGDNALIGPQSIFGKLSQVGYDVFPPNTPPGDPAEHPRWGGGYTVGRYGSHNADGIDAMQIEIGSSFRQPNTIAALVRDLTDAIGTFYSGFISATATSEVCSLTP
jgi:N-formylglutamate amidohydrolase